MEEIVVSFPKRWTDYNGWNKCRLTCFPKDKGEKLAIGSGVTVDL